MGLLHSYFYKGKTKIFSKDIFDLITPRALAIWFMDDGSNTQNSYTISTHCFSEKEQKSIINFLKKRYDINATMVRDRSKFKIALGRKEYQKLNAIIEPYIIPSMIYKIESGA